MPTYVEIGRRIRQARTEKALMQADLGQLLSKSRSHAAISDIERGRTKLNVDELAEIAELLDKPLSFLMEGATVTAPVAGETVYFRRDQSDLTDGQKQETESAVSAFMQLARERAAKESRDT
jgi:transcriptional regulator with XRE-family HTH domain